METDNLPTDRAVVSIIAGGFKHRISVDDYRNADELAEMLHARIENHWNLSKKERFQDVFHFTNPQTFKQVGVKVADVTGYEIELI